MLMERALIEEVYERAEDLRQGCRERGSSLEGWAATLGPPQVIGPPSCPIVERWTLEWYIDRGGKLMVHHFLPSGDERDMHDHPWCFATHVLEGYYVDVSPLGEELVSAGRTIFRWPEHRHRTRAGPRGAWTLVLTGGVERAWGFYLDGEWLPWREYEARVGFGMRCE